jgi:hypothetical protein
VPTRRYTILPQNVHQQKPSSKESCYIDNHMAIRLLVTLFIAILSFSAHAGRKLLIVPIPISQTGNGPCLGVSYIAKFYLVNPSPLNQTVEIELLSDPMTAHFNYQPSHVNQIYNDITGKILNRKRVIVVNSNSQAVLEFALHCKVRGISQQPNCSEDYSTALSVTPTEIPEFCSVSGNLFFKMSVLEDRGAVTGVLFYQGQVLNQPGNQQFQLYLNGGRPF